MDFHALEYIVAIAEHQNLTKAAEALYVGQPTLSKFLMSLEAELGFRLFRRVGRRYVPTYAGERYLERATAILRMKQGLDLEMADILKREVGEVRVAFANMRCAYMLPTVLPAFSALRPNVSVRLFEGSSDENDRRLMEGQVDAAFYSMPSVKNPHIEYLPLAREELLICAPKGHPLARRAVAHPDSRWPRVELEWLEGERALLMRLEHRTRQIVDGILREHPVRFGDVLYTSNIQAILGLVAGGYGVSFVFDAHLRHRCREPLRGEKQPICEGIDCYSFGQPRTLCDFVAATRKGDYLSQHVREFIEVVKRSV